MRRGSEKNERDLPLVKIGEIQKQTDLQDCWLRPKSRSQFLARASNLLKFRTLSVVVKACDSS